MSRFTKLFFILAATLPMVVIMLLIFYIEGVKKYGTPAEFRERRLAEIQAGRDSIEAERRNRLLPENAADSTLFEIGRHGSVFEATEDNRRALEEMQAVLDSIDAAKQAIESQKNDIEREIEQLMNDRRLTEDVKLGKLAELYDNIKPAQAVPMMTALDDSLAMGIINRMTPRNASKLLGALAQADLEKAARLNRLLAGETSD